MSTLTQAQQDRILQVTSAHFLTSPYPDTWDAMGADEQSEYVNDHMWAPLEGSTPEEVMSIIDDAAYCTGQLIIELNEVSTS